MDLFIVIHDAAEPSASEPGKWVLGDSEEDVLLEAFGHDHKSMDYLIERETDIWHRYYAVERRGNRSRGYEDMFDYYVGACASVTSYLGTAGSLDELYALFLEAAKQARALGGDIKDYVDFYELPEFGGEDPEEPVENGIWSWDRTRFLVEDANDPAGCRIIPRQDT
jgi:hypothetical protein